MRKLLIGLLAVVFVLGMSSGVMADEYLEDLGKEVDSTFEVGINIAPYVVMDDLGNINLNNFNNDQDNSVHPGDIPGQNKSVNTDIVANYDFQVTVSSNGLEANGTRGNSGNHLDDLINYDVSLGDQDIPVYTASGGSTRTVTADSRRTSFEFGVDFANGEDISWEDYTAGNYTDTITVTVSSTLHH